MPLLINPVEPHCEQPVTKAWKTPIVPDAASKTNICCTALNRLPDLRDRCVSGEASPGERETGQMPGESTWPAPSRLFDPKSATRPLDHSDICANSIASAIGWAITGQLMMIRVGRRPKT